jgi:hypothetical protein
VTSPNGRATWFVWGALAAALSVPVVLTILPHVRAPRPGDYYSPYLILVWGPPLATSVALWLGISGLGKMAGKGYRFWIALAAIVLSVLLLAWWIYWLLSILVTLESD